MESYCSEASWIKRAGRGRGNGTHKRPIGNRSNRHSQRKHRRIRLDDLRREISTIALQPTIASVNLSTLPKTRNAQRKLSKNSPSPKSPRASHRYTASSHTVSSPRPYQSPRALRGCRGPACGTCALCLLSHGGRLCVGERSTTAVIKEKRMVGELAVDDDVVERGAEEMVPVALKHGQDFLGRRSAVPFSGERTGVSCRTQKKGLKEGRD